MISSTESHDRPQAANDSGGDIVFEISCNLDDMTPEAIGAAFDLLLDSGALDVFTTPIMMKKNRPAVMLTCLSAVDTQDELAKCMLEHTTTLGVRIRQFRRSILDRDVRTVTTDYGDIRVKTARGYGVIKCKPEYDDVQNASKKHGVPFIKVHDAAMEAARETGS